MANINNFIDFVKAQGEFHGRQANKYVSDLKRNSLHKDTAKKFGELQFFLESLHKKPLEVSNNKLSLNWEEVSDLPEELLAELSISEADKTEFNVMQVLQEAGGIASLDRMLVGYYRMTGEIMKRSQMNNRIYRMIQKGMMFSVPGKKGVYSLCPISEEESAGLI